MRVFEIGHPSVDLLVDPSVDPLVDRSVDLSVDPSVCPSVDSSVEPLVEGFILIMNLNLYSDNFVSSRVFRKQVRASK